MPPSGTASRTSCRCCNAKTAPGSIQPGDNAATKRQHRIRMQNGRPKRPFCCLQLLQRPQPPSLPFNAVMTATGAAAVAGMPRGSTADT